MTNIHFNSTMIVLIIILLICITAIGIAICILSKLRPPTSQNQKEKEVEYGTVTTMVPSTIQLIPNRNRSYTPPLHGSIYPKVIQGQNKAQQLQSHPKRNRRSLESFYYIPAEVYRSSENYKYPENLRYATLNETKQCNQRQYKNNGTIRKNRTSVYYV